MYQEFGNGAQLFCARLAEEKGFNPDQPRTLSKVTRTL